MLIDTIEQNFDLPIHHYVNVDFAGFQGLVEAVGSVEVYFDTPARDWNVNAKPAPRSQTGFLVEEAGCHALDPPTALAYVRSRYYQTQSPDGTWVTDPTSDFGRIGRQQDFLRRLMYRAIELGARNPFVLADLVDTGLENVAIDESLTPQLLIDLGSAYRNFDPGSLQTYSFPVVDAEIDGNQVLEPVLDRAEPLLAFMRGAPHDDPSTVDLSVVTPVGGSTDPALSAADLVRGLREEGFDPRQESGGQVPGGVTIHHGPNGATLALGVVDALDGIMARLEPVDGSGRPPVTVVEIDGLDGRTIHLLVGNNAAGGGPAAESSASTSVGDSAPFTLAPGPTPAPVQPSVAAPSAEPSPSSTTMDQIDAADGRMANESSSSTLNTGKRDELESRDHPVDSEEPACRST